MQQRDLVVFDQPMGASKATRSFTAFGCNGKTVANDIVAWKVLSLGKKTSFSLTLARINC